jgi:hypothetical protein
MSLPPDSRKLPAPIDPASAYVGISSTPVLTLRISFQVVLHLIRAGLDGHKWRPKLERSGI